MNTPRTSTRGRDAGMTLPELLIAVAVMGLIASVLSASIIVTLRQSRSTEGRINVARSEQSIDTWLPTDLASTDVTNTTLPAVDVDADATPCGNCGTLDLSGANALQLAWTTTEVGPPAVDVVTRVQYQYIEVDGEWQIQRIECVGASPCTMNVMLHDMPGPPNPDTFNPDTDRPVWVMDVAAPANPEDLELSDNARRIVVTIDGGGANEGAGGGLNTVSLTAGGATTNSIEADDFTVPAFVRARSRCGGPVTLVIDDSGSITQSNVDNVVRPGVEAFIEAFRGTPTQVQVIQFSSTAKAIGPGSGWHRYVDMTDDAAVDQLKSSLSVLTADGGTNWEEAFFHTLKNSDGTPAATLPNRIVFFTDGIPTLNRTTTLSGWPAGSFINGTLVHYNDGPYGSGWPNENGSAFHQESFDRADVILDAYRGIDLIFVGVGAGLTSNNSWIYNPTVYADHNAPPAPATNKTGADILAYLLANGPSGQVPAVYDSAAGEYTNAETADFYLQSNFNQTAFGAAMKAAALKDCGGTLTIQTKYQGGPKDGQNVTDEFVYENLEYRDDSGTPVPAEARRVTTSALFRTGTFDFEISSDSEYFSVDVVPQELQTLAGYTPQGWSCRAGSTAKTLTSIPIDASPWEGFTVDVYPNEAVSCVLEVSQP
jgi:prepilin-type N-terminal cleavage/methylation domain-containing protein